MDEDWPRNEEERNGDQINKWVVTVRDPTRKDLGFLAVYWERDPMLAGRWEATSPEGWVSAIYVPTDEFPSVDLTNDCIMGWQNLRGKHLTWGQESGMVKESDWPEWFTEE